MQKYLIFSTFLFVSLNIDCLGQKQDKSTTAIQQILNNQLKSWNSGDLPSFMVGYWPSDSLMYLGKKGIKYGYENTLQNYIKGYPDRASMGTLAFDIKKIQKLGSKYRFVVGAWLLNRPINGNIEGYFSLVFRKIKGQWYIISDHSS
jgi:hypothetical protein